MAVCIRNHTVFLKEVTDLKIDGDRSLKANSVNTGGQASLYQGRSLNFRLCYTVHPDGILHFLMQKL